MIVKIFLREKNVTFNYKKLTDSMKIDLPIYFVLFSFLAISQRSEKFLRYSVSGFQQIFHQVSQTLPEGKEKKWEWNIYMGFFDATTNARH